MSVRQVLVTAATVILALGVGWWGRGAFSEHDMESGDSAMADQPCPGGVAPLYWKAPMDPTYVRDEPGKSPMGMDLVPECPSTGGDVVAGQVVIDSATMQNIGVRTTAVERRDLSRSIRAVGRVAYDERRVSHVHTKVQGWVERLFVDFVGQEVKRGQPLLEIYSPELVATQEELLLAARYQEATRESPFDDVRGGGESLLTATQRRLALWDVRQRDIDRLLETGQVKRTLTLYAPASGVVTSLGVRSGMEVQPNSNLYTIADLSKIWILADAYEYELPWLALGQEATVELGYLPGEAMRGELTYIAPFLDPQTRTAEVRLELDNEDGKLKPGMFGNAMISGTPHPGVLAIPSDSVIRSGTRTVAVVSLGEGRFEPRDIELGLDSGDGWLEVRSGLDEGEQIVISSQFLIDSESNLQEAVQKLLAAEEGQGAELADSAEPRDEEMAPDSMDHSEPMDHSTMDHSEHRGHERHDPAASMDSPPGESHEHHDMTLGEE